MTKEQLSQAQKLNYKIIGIESKILELQEYQKLLKGKKIEDIKIIYKEENSCHLIEQNEVPLNFIYEMNEKLLNELNNELRELLKEFKEL